MIENGPPPADAVILEASINELRSFVEADLEFDARNNAVASAQESIIVPDNP